MTAAPTPRPIRRPTGRPVRPTGRAIRPTGRAIRRPSRSSALLDLLPAATLAVALSGCTGSPTVIGEEYDGAGPGAVGSGDPSATGPAVGWVETGRSFFVTTYGSSSCPLAPTDLGVDGDTLDVTMTAQGGDVCTADFGPTSYSLDLPGELRASDRVAVRLLFETGDVSELHLER